MKQNANSQEHTYGKIYLDNNTIILERDNEEILRLAVTELKLIGEFTTANGPIDDDWYIVFMTSEKNWYQIPEYTPGMLELLQELSGVLREDVMCSLFGSTSWATRILWPKAVEGAEIWDIEPVPASTFFQQVKRVFGMSHQSLILIPVALRAFA